MLSPSDIARSIPDDKISSVISEMYPDKDRMRAEYGVVASGLIHDSDGGVRTFVGFKDYLTKRVVFLTLILDPDDEAQMNLRPGMRFSSRGPWIVRLRKSLELRLR